MAPTACEVGGLHNNVACPNPKRVASTASDSCSLSSERANRLDDGGKKNNSSFLRLKIRSHRLLTISSALATAYSMKRSSVSPGNPNHNAHG